MNCFLNSFKVFIILAFFSFSSNLNAQIFYELCSEIESSLPTHVICDINTLDQFTGTLTTSTSGTGPMPLCPTQGGIPSNIMWFGFVAPSGNYQIEIVPSNCTIGTTGFTGIQVGIYTDCTFEETIWCAPNCTENPIASPMNITNPGEVYYFFMTGCVESICDFQINILGTATPFVLPLPDQISIENTCSPFPLCNGAELTLQVENYVDLELEYEWFVSRPDTTNTTVINNTATYDYLFDLPGDYTVCVSTTNGCNLVSNCEIFTIEEIQEETFNPVAMCKGEFWLGPGDDEDNNGDGIGWDGGFIVIEDDDDIDDGVFVAENLTETPCGCVYLQTVEITVLEDPPTEVVDLEICDNAFPYTFSNMQFNSPVEDFVLFFTGQASNGCDSTLLLTIESIPCFEVCAEVPIDSMECDLLNIVPELSFEAFPSSVASGESLCLPLKVNDFRNIAALQFTLSFDPCIMNFTGVNQVGTAFEGTNEILNTVLSNQGNIGYLWFDSSGQGQCLADGATLIEFCFDFIGDVYQESNIFISNNILDAESGFVADFSEGICESTINNIPTTISISCDTLNILQRICYDEDGRSNVFLSACGGTAPYQFLFGGETQLATSDGFEVTYSNFIPTTYLATVTDVNDVVATAPVVVGLETPLEYVILITEPSCTGTNDGKINIMRNDSVALDLGINKVEWENNIFNIDSLDNLAAGMYSLTLTDEGGCTYEETVTLEALNANNTIEMDSLCAGSGFSVVVGTDLYNESNPMGTTILTSSSGCDSIVDVSLMFFANKNVINDILCLDDEIIVNGTVYNQNNSSGLEIIPGGGINNCDSIIEVDLSFLDFNLVEIMSIQCPGETVILEGVELGPTNMTDTVFVSDATGMGCDTLVSLELIYYPEAVSIIDSILCEGESISINGTIYDMLNPLGNEVITNITEEGCDSTVLIDLEFYQNTTIVLDTVLCFGEVLEVGSGVFVSPVESQVVTLEDADQNNCDSIITLTLNFHEEIIIALNTLEPDTGSDNGKIIVDISGAVQPLNIEWSNGVLNTNEINNLQTGNYTIMLTDANGCQVSESFFVDFVSDLAELNLPKVQLFPNPFSDELIVVLPVGFSNAELTLFSIDGKVIFTDILDSRKESINVETFSIAFRSTPLIIFSHKFTYCHTFLVT